MVIKKENLGEYLKSTRFKVVFEDKSVTVLENLEAFPRAFMVYDGKDDNEFKISKVEYMKNDSGGSSVSIETQKEGLLLVSDSFYPGWKAYIDGSETKISKERDIFRGVIVPEGTHQVKFIYRPESFDRGLTISVISLLSLLGLIGYTSLKYRKSDVKN